MFYVYMQKGFSGAVYQDRSAFYYFKNNIKRYPKMGRMPI